MFDMFEAFRQHEGSGGGQQAACSSGQAACPSIFAISVGGSVFFEEKPLVSAISKFGDVINRLAAENYRFVLVVGGGGICRNYAAAAKSLGASNFAQDEVGIALTRANARLFIHAIESAHSEVLTEISRAKQVIDAGKVAVFGGLMPGITTDAVAALIAESLGATFVNLTNVRGIYSMDPKKHRGAKFFPEIDYNRLISLMKLAESKPAQNIVLDLPCCLILRRSSIKGLVLKGTDLANFEAAIRGGEFRGTIIEAKEEEVLHSRGAGAGSAPIIGDDEEGPESGRGYAFSEEDVEEIDL